MNIYKQMNNIDDKESLSEKYNVRTFRDIKRLHEAMTPENNDLQLIKSKMISDSKYSDPIRVRVQIDTPNAKFKNGYDLQAAIKRTISGVTMQPEIRVDESDGSYQLCFPGKSDWLKSVTEMLQYNISGKLTVEEV